MGYFKDALKGISWMGALQVFTLGLSVIKIGILARVLSPAQFGIYGIALLVLGFLEVLTETGINVFLIQENDKTEDYLDSAWVVSMLRGVLISVAILILSPFIISFFKEPLVAPLLYLVALIAFVRGFINPMSVTFQKTLQFHKEFFYQISLTLVDMLVAVVVGVITKSESALIISMLTAAIFEVGLSFSVFKIKPKLAFDFEKVKKVIDRGKWITGAGAFNYFFQNIDNIVVGKLLGAGPLGLYQQAYRVSTLPVSQVGEIFNKVTFPIYVQINSDLVRLKKVFIKTFLVILLLMIPFGILIFLFAKPLILIFLGPKWLGAESALKVLVIFGVFKAILNSSYSLFLSLKKQEIVMLSELFGIIGISISIVPLVIKFGLVGAGISTIIGALLSMPIILINFKKVFTNEKI